nr:T9SS type A sorting domain-containing protein [Bacteroidia bacterium]
LNSNLISIQKDNYSNGRIDLAVVRTDKQNQSGHGTIGILSIDMKDDLSGRTDIFKMLELSFSNVSLIRFDGTTIPVNAINDSIVVHDEITALQQLQMLQNSVSLIPNPAKEKVTINWNSTIEEVTEISICSAIGETVLKKQVSAKSKFELSTSELNAGVYIVKMQTNKGSISKKLCIIN